MAFTLAELSSLDAVSGAENEALAYLIPIIREKCDNIDVDSMGNIIALKKGKSDKYKILLGASIDEVGFIVNDITDSGFVKFKAVGNVDPRTIVSKCVRIGDKKVQGVIGMKAIHLQKKEEREATVKIKDLFIDIGAESKEKAQEKVSLGDRIYFSTEFEDKGEIIKGKALNRLSVVPLLEVMDQVPAFDTYYVFAAQSEVLCSVMGRGLRVASFRIDPDFALVINTVNSDDFYNAKCRSARLGDGFILEHMDKSNISAAVFSRAIRELADRNKISYQNKTSSLGASPTGGVLAAGTGAVVASVAIACRYYRTPVEYMNKNDIDAVTELCRAFIKESDVVINGIIKDIN